MLSIPDQYFHQINPFKIKLIAASRRNRVSFIWSIMLIIICFSPVITHADEAEKKPYYLNIFAGQMTTNHWENFFGVGEALDFKNSYFAAASIARRIGAFKKMASFEIEGQVVKHFNIQNHWELNALVTARWDAFWWDKYIDTSLAFGLGPSYATADPEIEIMNDGTTSKWLAYWMMELTLGLPEYSRVSLITRLHHRSNAYGLFADKGGSNALAIGLKYRF
ncbi:MAG: hypothetical protein CVU71_13550 [Deltaproteobacteria bacterium HGW-Deltaproteobacteria-6]|nr:MAG: hypothetical protein CVU71_13550 [Deltaproteobacteria bacterium HGW-Deltaproteobacteria-6]